MSNYIVVFFFLEESFKWNIAISIAVVLVFSVYRCLVFKVGYLVIYFKSFLIFKNFREFLSVILLKFKLILDVYLR